jgi:hypothetical protein
MRDRLRLNRLNDPSPAHGRRDAIPFRAPAQAAPFHAWRPREDLDTIANAESALDHAQRQLDNLRALLGQDREDDPRAA